MPDDSNKSYRNDERELPQYQPGRSYHCMDCGYDLRNLERFTCPECGRPFDPDDPRSYRSRPYYPFERLRDQLLYGNDLRMLLQHLPEQEREDVFEAVHQSKHVRTAMRWPGLIILIVLIANALFVGLTSTEDGNTSWFMSILPIGMTIVVLVIALTRGYVMRRAYREELRRMDIRPVICLKCGYELTGIHASRCPKCDTPFANENGTHTDAKNPNPKTASGRDENSRDREHQMQRTFLVTLRRK